MAKRVMKRERTNQAIEFDTLEAIQAATTIEEGNEFLLAKLAERASDRTIRDYKTYFRYFRTWLDNQHPEIKLSQVTTKIIHSYISYMTNEKRQYDDHPSRSTQTTKLGVVGLSPMTVNVRIRTLRAFFNWCYRNGHIHTNVVQDVKLQKVDQDRIMAFTSEQIQTLLSLPEKRSFSGFRDYVMMYMLLDTGLRIRELLALTVENVNFGELQLIVPWEKAKTRKTRSVPISKKIAKLL